MKECSNPVTGKGFLALAEAGMANATRSVEMLAPGRLTMDVLWAGSVPTPRLCEISGDPEDFVAGAYVRVTGDVPGHALLIFPRKSAMMLADIVLDQPVGTTTDLGEMEQSLLQEAANILTSSYITAMADYYCVTLWPEPPLMAMDMAAALVDSVLINSGQFESETLSIVTRFRGNAEVIDGYFLYIPESLNAAEMEAA